MFYTVLITTSEVVMERTDKNVYYQVYNLLLAPFIARPLTLVPRSLILNHTETLATQANFHQKGFTPGRIFLKSLTKHPKSGER